jgi:aspartyl/asparaginyl beta-hydroxylase (cupin superfamily)
MDLFLKMLAATARLNQLRSRLGNPFFYRNGDFPWAAKFERDWRFVRVEFDRLMERRDQLPAVQEIITGASSITQDQGWKLFVLICHGIRSQRNIKLCPQTWRIVQQVPGLRTAMFSIFEPGKRLPPHRGPYNGVLRAHLGLLVPEPPSACAIRVGSEIRSWREGEVLIFDDSHEHETWNDTDGQRAVLFIDFLRPLRFPANILNRTLLTAALFTPYLREGRENLRRWERQSS